MADNLETQSTAPATPPAGKHIATYEIADFSGDTAHIAPTVLGTVAGAEGARTFTPISGSNPLPVSVNGVATAAGQSTTNATLAAIVNALTGVTNGSELQVDVVASALPSGAATETNQIAANALLADIKAAVEALTTALEAIGGEDLVKVGIFDNAGNQIISFGGGPGGAGIATETEQQVQTGHLISIKSAVEALAALISGGALQVAITSGGLTISKPDTATLSNVVTSTTSAQLVAGNAGRLGLLIHNDSDSPLLVKYGATASTTSFTARIDPHTTWQEPTGYTGRIDGILLSGSGAARVTELTAS